MVDDGVGSVGPVGGWKLEMAMRLATTDNPSKTQAREDNSSRQFSSVL